MEQKPTYLLPIICSVAICPIADLISFTEKPNLQVEINVVAWQQIYSTAGTANFTQPLQPSPNGHFYNQLVELSYPGLHTQHFAQFFTLHNNRFLVKITYSNGDIYIIGNPYAQAQATYNYNAQNNQTLVYLAVADALPAHKLYVATTPPQGIGTMQIESTFIVT